MIGERTKAALAAAKARGVRLGGDPRNLDGVRERGAVASAKARGEKADRRAQSADRSGASKRRRVAPSYYRRIDRAGHSYGARRADLDGGRV